MYIIGSKKEFVVIHSVIRGKINMELSVRRTMVQIKIGANLLVARIPRKYSAFLMIGSSQYISGIVISSGNGHVQIANGRGSP